MSMSFIQGKYFFISLSSCFKGVTVELAKNVYKKFYIKKHLEYFEQKDDDWKGLSIGKFWVELFRSK